KLLTSAKPKKPAGEADEGPAPEPAN
ncbi:1-acyl-sn-glycerol-3-phosphate acyltransferase, partial [Burkholderia multivorans]